ncbi:hypothetical protein Cco03nite_18440 [Catellatospora coxensis]|uniref:Uncharacterized protein n=1 Tax=Catellatospora coxensis TaxID=310354 RepID=A0A8J3KU35_9ACTN|nr:hypothetical protein Cco03nite_18440 [Catellatospora coxensis]
MSYVTVPLPYHEDSRTNGYLRAPGTVAWWDRDGKPQCQRARRRRAGTAVGPGGCGALTPPHPP